MKDEIIRIAFGFAPGVARARSGSVRGKSGAFGAAIKMPTLEKLTADGLKENRFQTAALCSPRAT